MSSRRRTAFGASVLAVLVCAAVIPAVLAHLGPVPVGLKGISPPEVPGLTNGPDPIIVDRAKALVLGKALFWDINVGSDGMACASCHFHAGADRRVRNQVAPGGVGVPPATAVFDAAAAGGVRGPNYTLRRGDFPFTQSAIPTQEISIAGLRRSSDDVTGSAGTFGGRFRSVELLDESADNCVREADPVFHVAGTGARRVIDRNAPSVINAVFNYRNFWDGRANNVFNGSSPWGDRDPDAGVWIRQADGTVAKRRLRLSHSALASVALAAPVSAVEMGCEARTLADVGRKLMWRRPLEHQTVHPQDSVLGAFASQSGQTGLNTYYVTLVRQAFAPRFWSSGARGPFGAPKPARAGETPLPYNQYEANFGMFFALALQVYQATLVSDDSPFDRSRRDADGVPVDLSESEIRGFQAFRTGHCNLCHIGPLFTSSAIETNALLVKANPKAFGNETFTISTTRNVVVRTPAIRGSGFVDTGFAATGVGEDVWDPGLSGRDRFGYPLSFAEQYLQFLAGNRAAVVDAPVRSVRPCDLQLPIALSIGAPHPLIFTAVDGVQPQSQDTAGCYSAASAFVPTIAAARAELAKPATRKMLTIVRGAFKVPSLRNVELTGPYMHNGSMASLDEVVEFYARGGNFDGEAKQFGMVFPQPELQLSAQARADVVNFLRTLTDDRVRFERAPFDHPALAVPHGHPGDHTRILGASALNPALGADEWLTIPAVGAGGRTEPLPPFESFLAP